MPAVEMFLSTFLVRKGKAVVGLCEPINNGNLNFFYFGLYSGKSCSSGFSTATTWFSQISVCLCLSVCLIKTNNLLFTAIQTARFSRKP